jgi:formate dehydrogenase subunit gamma
MSAPPRLGEAQHSGTPTGRPRDLIVRYNASERTNHWLGAIAFILVAISGLALFHPALFFLSNLMGGGPWTRILHPYLGLVMCVSFVFLAARVARDNRMQPRDWQWLRQYRDVIENREERLPEVGRYNAGQKLVFYSVVLCLGVLLVTGIAIWRVYTAGYFPVGVVRLGSVLHAIAALVLICTIIVHVYAAIWVKGSVEAMTRGTVTPGWAWKHHRAWFREIIRHAANPRSGAD